MKVLLLFIVIQQIFAVPKCCNDENIIVGKNCMGNHPLQLDCPTKYILPTTDEYNAILDDNDNLVLHDNTITSDKYCTTHRNGSNKEIYIVCFEDNEDEEAKFVVNGTFLLISAVFLLLTVAIYCQLPYLLDLQGICMLHSIGSMAIACIILGINQFYSSASDVICLTNAYLMYFCWLYSFFWFNTLSFHIWRTTVQSKRWISEKYWSYIYHAYAIAMPILLLIFLIIAHHSSIELLDSIKPGLANGKCWFESKKTEFIYFYGPMTILLCLNIIYYTWTIYVLWKNIAKFNEKSIKILKYRLRLCVKLFFIMGITWIFEIISAAIDNNNITFNVIWFITDAFNALQGLLIFLILVIFRKRVIRGLANRTFLGRRLPNRWTMIQDDECDEDIEEEFRLSETSKP